MSVTRFLVMPALICGLVVLGLVISPAVGNSGENTDSTGFVRPTFHGSVSWSEGLAIAEVEGPPGAPVTLRVTMFTQGPGGQTVTRSDISGTFDSTGLYMMAASLGDLAGWTDFDLVLEAVVASAGGDVLKSDTWGLRKRSLDPSSPNAPVAPGGGTGAVAAPGTVAPLLPYSWAALPYGQDVILFQCAPTGIEGVIPVN